jgi:hypothetical protein
MLVKFVPEPGGPTVHVAGLALTIGADQLTFKTVKAEKASMARMDSAKIFFNRLSPLKFQVYRKTRQPKLQGG